MIAIVFTFAHVQISPLATIGGFWAAGKGAHRLHKPGARQLAICLAVGVVHDEVTMPLDVQSE